MAKKRTCRGWQPSRSALDRKDKPSVFSNTGTPPSGADPGGSRRFLTGIMIRVVPGVGSFNVSNALMKTDVGCNGAVVVATPGGLKDNPDLVKSLAEKGETLCIFMGLKHLDELTEFLRKWYSARNTRISRLQSGILRQRADPPRNAKKYRRNRPCGKGKIPGAHLRGTVPDP